MSAEKQKHTEEPWESSATEQVGKLPTDFFVLKKGSNVPICICNNELTMNKVVAAHNNTYAAGLNPSAVPGLVEELEKAKRQIDVMIGHSCNPLEVRLAGRTARNSIDTALAAAKIKEGE